MSLYCVVLSCVAIFFYKEGKSMKQMHSRFLSDFNDDPNTAILAAKQLFFISTCSILSSIFMLFSLLSKKIPHTSIPILFAALSFLIYSFGFIWGTWHCYKLKQSIQQAK